MSDIVNKLTGRTFRQVDPTLSEILVDLGLMEYFRTAQQPMAAPRPSANTFKIGASPIGKLSITLTTPSGRVAWYECPQYVSDLQPAKIRDVFKTLAWSGEAQAQILQGPEVPEQIVRDFIEQAQYESRVNGATNAKLQQVRDSRA